MITLKNEIQRLRREAEGYTYSPLLGVFDLGICEKIDHLFQTDSFIRKKRDSILCYLNGLGIDFDEKWKSAVDCYNEVGIYIHFKYDKIIDIEPVPESSGKTPDFKITVSNNPFFIELKTLHFAAAGCNYKQTLENGLNATIEIENQIRQGNIIAFGETVIAPFYRNIKGYDANSMKYYIEAIITKIEQNIKPDQFNTGDTFLLVDLKLVGKLSCWQEASVAVYQEQQYKSMVSGELWNITFGKIGQPVLRAIEFEGKENIEGELNDNGVLTKHSEIKGLCFRSYDMKGSSRIVGFYRHYDIDSLAEPLNVLCDFTNDDHNSKAWRVLR